MVTTKTTTKKPIEKHVTEKHAQVVTLGSVEKSFPHLSLLSDKRIIEERERGNIVIEAFDERQLGSNSYDCRLGEHYYSPNPHMGVELDFTKEYISKDYWQLQHAYDGYVRIGANSTILAHTIEAVGGTNGFTTKMKCRSSIARAGLSVCKCAGLGDVGYISRWAMEITNHTHYPVKLPVGLRVCQMEFCEVGETLKQYTGKYGSAENWTPEDMLPKLYKDWDIEQVLSGKYR